MNKDPSFDRLLEGVAATPRDQRHAFDDCLDAELLAAWSDGALGAAERAAAEAHAAGCDRCLAMLGAMARTAPPPSAAGTPGWFSVRWLVPLGTAAVALIALVVVLRTPDQSVPVTPPAPTVAVEEPRDQTPAAKRDREAAPQAAVDAFEDKAASDKVKQNKLAQKEVEQKEEQQQARTANESLRKDSLRPPAAASAPAAAPAEADKNARFELRREAAKAAGIIVSPQSSSQWRIDGQSVKRSTDGGISWQIQTTGTTVDLLAGSSPSPTVCWIVGRSGTVILSTDGTTWRRLTVPQPTIDVVGVTAADRLTATVTTAPGRVYRTIDAGRTWTLQ
ncbi:MAG: YCF48-related protein [Vicinamibacterales bacterium]